MGTDVKHPVPDGVKQSFVIFDIQLRWHTLSVRGLECPKLQMRLTLDPVWHRL